MHSLGPEREGRAEDLLGSGGVPRHPHPKQHPRNSLQLKVGQQSPSHWLRTSSSPGPHSGGLWWQVLMLQTAGEVGCRRGDPALPTAPVPRVSPYRSQEVFYLCGPSGPLTVTFLVLPKSLDRPEGTSFIFRWKSYRTSVVQQGSNQDVVALLCPQALLAGRAVPPPPALPPQPPPGPPGGGAHHTASPCSTGCRPVAWSRARSQAGHTPGAGPGPRTARGHTALTRSPRHTRRSGSR